MSFTVVNGTVDKLHERVSKKSMKYTEFNEVHYCDLNANFPQSLITAN